MITNRTVDNIISTAAVATCIIIFASYAGESILRFYHNVAWDDAQVRVENIKRLCTVVYSRRSSVSHTRFEDCSDAVKHVEGSARNDYVLYTSEVSYNILRNNMVLIRSPVVLYPAPVGSVIDVKYSTSKLGDRIDRAFGRQDVYTILSTLLTCGLFQIPFIAIRKVLVRERKRSAAKSM